MKMIQFAVTTDTHYGFDRSTRKIHEKFWKKLGQEIQDKSLSFLIISGDMISHKQEQFDKLFALVRQHISIPILVVRGNHDFWSYRARKKLSWETLNNTHAKVFEKYNIHHLQDNPFVIDEVVILGFDGWYHLANPPTNDIMSMPTTIESVPIHLYLNHKAHKDFEKILDFNTDPFRAVIGVTHFPPFTEHTDYLAYCANPKYLEPMKEKFDILIVGHSHKARNEIEDGCRIVNVGSDYNIPKYAILEI